MWEPLPQCPQTCAGLWAVGAALGHQEAVAVGMVAMGQITHASVHP